MKKNIALSFLLVLISLLPAVTVSAWQGIDAWTGEDWQALQPESKPPFLLGMIEGLKFRGPDMGPWEPACEEIEDYIPEIDRLYEDPKNIYIPVVLILDYVNSELAGMDKDELDYRLKNLKEIVRVNSK